MSKSASNEQPTAGSPGSWWDMVGGALLFSLASFWTAILLRVVSTPENHIGLNILWALPLASLAVVVGGLWRVRGRRRFGLALLCLGGLSILGIIALDRLNILVFYETWLKRGMPDRPF